MKCRATYLLSYAKAACLSMPLYWGEALKPPILRRCAACFLFARNGRRAVVLARDACRRAERQAPRMGCTFGFAHGIMCQKAACSAVWQDRKGHAYGSTKRTAWKFAGVEPCQPRRAGGQCFAGYGGAETPCAFARHGGRRVARLSRRTAAGEPTAADRRDRAACLDADGRATAAEATPAWHATPVGQPTAELGRATDGCGFAADGLANANHPAAPAIFSPNAPAAGVCRANACATDGNRASPSLCAPCSRQREQRETPIRRGRNP